MKKIWTLASVLAVVLAASVPAAAQDAGGVPAREPAREPAAGGVIVKYEEGVGAGEQAGILREEGLDKNSDLGLINADAAEVEDGSVSGAIEDLEDNPDVAYAEPDRVVRPMDVADEPRFGELWGMHNTGQGIKGRPGVPNADVNAPEASAITRGDEDVVVAVVDDGVQFSHPDLAGRQWVNPGETPGNGVDDDGNGYVDDVNGWNWYDDSAEVFTYNPHGTHVAGTIAASEDGRGVVGVAPDVKIMALKFLGGAWGSGRLSDQIEAVEYARKEGADVINASFGCQPCAPSRAEKEAIERSGMLFVAAAGNGGMDGRGDDTDANPRKSNYPSSYDSPNILSVAAVDNRGRLARFSNYGDRTVDISAPGVDVLSTVPDYGREPGLVLSSAGALPGEALVSSFGVDEVAGATARASFVGRALEAVGRTDEPVVVVDDDYSFHTYPDGLSYPDVAPGISEAVASATGAAPEKIEVREGGGPDLSRLEGKVVVWSTGATDRSTTSPFGFDPDEWPLTRGDRATLTRFLEGGGKLILNGSRPLWNVEESSFVLDTLRIDTTISSSGMIAADRFDGAEGTLFAGESYGLTDALGYPQGVHQIFEPIDASTAAQGVIYADPYDYYDGTSMAAPHATGVAALVASQFPTLEDRPLLLKKALMQNGKWLPDTRGKTATGKMVDARKAVTNGASGG